MKLSRLFLGTLFTISLTAFARAESASPTTSPNILFIAIDDQNDWIGALGGHPQVKTPNIDALAARGTLFTNAHCQAPLCNPSRSSVLTGLRPSTTGIHGLSPGIREVGATKDVVTLPQTFTRDGWFTYTCGKIYHDGSVTGSAQTAEFNTWGPSSPTTKPAKPFTKLVDAHPLMDWGPFPERDEDAADWKIASAAAEALREAPKDKPFFIAAGFRLPHVPCYAPQKWFDLYPAESLRLPTVLETDRDDTPHFSWYLHWKLPEPRLSTMKRLGEWRDLVRAYLASTSFMDAQVGRVLKALEATGRADNTIVVLWSDHGYHLGEKLITGKNSLWKESTHVPLIFAGPGISRAARYGSPVELLDIFPTLLALTGMPARTDLEGHSLVPQLRDATAPRPWPAITTHNRGNHAVRTNRWRYIRYADQSEELYDLAADPHEWNNLAADPTTAPTRRELAAWIPQTDVPAAPGSKNRVLAYDSVSDEAMWEGKAVKRSDPIPE